MKQCIEKAANIIIKIITVLAIVMFSILTITNLIGTTRIDTKLNRFREYAIFEPDYYPVTILSIGLFLGILVLIEKKWGFANLNTRRLRIFATFFILYLGLAWIIVLRAWPISDQGYVKEAAVQFLEGNYEMLAKGEYLYIYPFQLGITFLFECCFLIFGKGNYHAIMLINIFMVLGIFQLLYCILKQLTDSRKVWNFYWIMTCGCFPLVFYCVFVYGTIWGLFFALGGVWFAIRFRGTYQIRYLLISLLSFCMAVISKSNYMIFLIGTILVLLFHLIQAGKFRYLMISLILLLALWAPKSIEFYYETISGRTIGSGEPVSLPIAMGLQDGDKVNGCGAAGWYNKYNIRTFESVDYDAEKADALAKENMRERMTEFRDHPLKLGNFLGEKIATQWAEPTFQTFWMTQAVDNHYKQISLVKNLTEGTANKILIRFMKIYLLMIWAGNLVYLIVHYKKMDIWHLLLSIIVIGGFIFHTVWEGKALYIMPYFAISLVSGIQGILWMSENIAKRIKR